MHNSDNPLFGDFTVTLQTFIPLLNFNSTKNEAFVTVLHEKYTTNWPSCPGTSLCATNAIFCACNFDLIPSTSIVGRSK